MTNIVSTTIVLTIGVKIILQVIDLQINKNVNIFP